MFCSPFCYASEDRRIAGSSFAQRTSVNLTRVNVVWRMSHVVYGRRPCSVTRLNLFGHNFTRQQLWIARGRAGLLGNTKISTAKVSRRLSSDILVQHLLVTFEVCTSCYYTLLSVRGCGRCRAEHVVVRRKGWFASIVTTNKLPKV